jgi:hypothetical protein
MHWAKGRNDGVFEALDPPVAAPGPPDDPQAATASAEETAANVPTTWCRTINRL